jgi:hypothetical protein
MTGQARDRRTIRSSDWDYIDARVLQQQGGNSVPFSEQDLSRQAKFENRRGHLGRAERFTVYGCWKDSAACPKWRFISF